VRALRWRRAAGAALTICLVATGVYAVYLWLFHGWAASTGPATSAADAQRAWHYAWSVRFLLMACVCFALAGVWTAWRRWRRRIRRAG
jgi:hypothetical protein